MSGYTVINTRLSCRCTECFRFRERSIP